jgi:peptide/nickel transport system substrate-binding protein
MMNRLLLSIDAGLESFKGYRITSTDPLTIEAYSDSYNTDAELNVLTLWPLSPYGLAGEDSWQMFAISNLAEANKELAYTSDKADILQVEQTSWLADPVLEILSKYLDQATSESYIPMNPPLDNISPRRSRPARYANLKKWYDEHGHFWVGTGPYYLDKVFTTEKTAVSEEQPRFPRPCDRWRNSVSRNLLPLSLDGPGQVKAGEEASLRCNHILQGCSRIYSPTSKV